MNLIVRLILSTIAVLVADLLLSGVSIGGMDTTSGIITALLVAVVLGLLNTIIKPILVFLTLPITVVTLGLFLLVINAVIVLLAARLIDSFTVQSFWWALGFSIIMSAVQGLLDRLDGNKQRQQ